MDDFMMMMMLNGGGHQLHNVQHAWPVVSCSESVSVPPEDTTSEEEEDQATNCDRKYEERKEFSTSDVSSNSFETSDADGEEEASSASSSSSGSSSSGDDDDDDDDDEDLDAQIEYLCAKANLLERVSRKMLEEKEYCASIARQERHAKEQDDLKQNTLWTHAREVLQVLYRGEAGPDLHEKLESSGKRAAAREDDNVKKILESASAARASWKDRYTCKSPKHRLIDISRVTCISSAAYGCAEHPAACTYSDQGLCSPPPQKRARRSLRRHAWMSKALQEMQYKVQNSVDPKECVDLREATAITDTPQLLVLANAPNIVIHANRACSLACGMTTTRVLGAPVETVFQVPSNDDEPTLASHSTRCDISLECLLPAANGTSDHISCTMRLLPVLVPVDSSGFGAVVGDNVRDTKTVVDISHVLIQLLPRRSGALSPIPASSLGSYSSSSSRASPPPPGRRLELVG